MDFVDLYLSSNVYVAYVKDLNGEGNGNLIKLIEFEYHLIDAIFYFAGFTIPIYFILKSRSKKLKVIFL